MEEVQVCSARLVLKPRSTDQLRAFQNRQTDLEMYRACGEMLEGVIRHPGAALWNTDWAILLPDGREVGDLCFKGAPDAEGRVEVGYGIEPPYRRRGYASEAVAALARWALSRGAACICAQTAPDNRISQRVLAACGFVRNGDGDEGPLFELRGSFPAPL